MKSRFVSEFSTDAVYAKDLVQLLITLLKAKDNSEVQDLCSSCIRYAGGNLYINIDGLDRPIYKQSKFIQSWTYIDFDSTYSAYTKRSTKTFFTIQGTTYNLLKEPLTEEMYFQMQCLGLSPEALNAYVLIDAMDYLDLDKYVPDGWRMSLPSLFAVYNTIHGEP